MARAIQLAGRGLFTTDPNPRVGCVLVKDDAVIAEGWHIRAGEPHAEIGAITNAIESTEGAVAYVTLEPCCHKGKTPPCTEALMAAGIKKIIAAMTDPNPQVRGKGLQFLKQHGIDCEQGLMSQQAETLNPGFIKRMQEGVPYVRCKLGMSMDAKLALANGVSQWITSEQSREDVQRLRARSSAILTGVNTVLVDDPSLNVRGLDTHDRQPLRVIIDSVLKTPVNAKIFTLPGETIIFSLCKDMNRLEQFSNKGIEVIAGAEDNKRVDIKQVLLWLAQHKQINEVLVEAGPTLSGAMLANNLIDELVIYKASVILGDKAFGLLDMPDFSALEQCPHLEIQDHRLIGPDEKIIYKVIH